MVRWPRGRYYRFRHGRWKRYKRLRRRRRYRRRRPYRRRSFVRRVKRQFFNPHPGTYAVRKTNPYNKMTIFFQGIIMIPRAQLIYATGTKKDLKNNYSYARVAMVDISLYKLLLATSPLDYLSKLGGPLPGAVDSKWPTAGISKFLQEGYPVADTSPSGIAKKPYTDPGQWWRWALIFMKPSPWSLQAIWPLSPEAPDMLLGLGQFQLFRHIKTTLKVLATDDIGGSSFSPVASLLVQDRYWGRRDEEGTPQEGAPPMLGKRAGNLEASETWSPAHPPPTGRDTFAPNKHMSFSKMIFPSFLTLSAIGASWSFPPKQKSIGRGSFSKHTMKGTNDPQGERWLTLFPKGWETTGDASAIFRSTDLARTIGQLYLAQGTQRTGTWRFGTAQFPAGMIPPDDPVFTMQPWAIIKIWSKWQLANTRRPWPWDTPWFVNFRE